MKYRRLLTVVAALVMVYTLFCVSAFAVDTDPNQRQNPTDSAVETEPPVTTEPPETEPPVTDPSEPEPEPPVTTTTPEPEPPVTAPPASEPPPPPVTTTAPAPEPTPASSAPPPASSQYTAPVVNTHSQTPASSVAASAAASSKAASSQAASAISLPDVESVPLSVPNLIGSGTEVKTENNNKMLGYIAWACIVIGIIIVLVVLFTGNRRGPRTVGRKRYRRKPLKARKKHLLDDKYYRNNKYR